MMKPILIVAICLFSLRPSAQSSVDVTIQLASKPTDDPSEWLFRVRILNKGFDKYWVHDTAAIQAGIGHAGIEAIVPHIWQKKGSTYHRYDNPAYFQGVFIPDATVFHCINCITLTKGDSLVFSVNLLRGQMMKKGRYRVQVSLSGPDDVCNGCDQMKIIESNYGFFEVDSVPKIDWDKIRRREW